MDIKLVKEILLILEKRPKDLDTAGQLKKQYFDNYSLDDIREVCKFLIDEDIINGKVQYADGSIFLIFIGNLKSLGINLLISLNDKKVYKEVLKLSKKQAITVLKVFEKTIEIKERKPLKIFSIYFLLPVLVAVIAGLIIYFLTKYII